MKVICVMVSSLNGKTTNGTNPSIYQWTSKEDQDYFFSLIENAECIVMGRKTYEHAKNIIQHRKGRLRIVLTSTPEKFQDQTIPGQLAFTSDSPSLLLKKLQKQHVKEVLLVGGSSTNTAFLKQDCIDELWLTLEPLIFPEGTPLFITFLKKKLKLLSVERLNNSDTMLLKYSLAYS